MTPSKGGKPRVDRRKAEAVIRQLLSKWGLWEDGETSWRSACPVHRGDNPTSFRINAWGSWRCFKCKSWGDLPRLVSILGGVNYVQAKTAIEQFPRAFVTLADVPELPPYEERRRGAKGYPLLPEASVILFRELCPEYLLARGFSEGSLYDFEIGYDTGSNRITLPMRDWEGKLVGLTYRLDFDAQGVPKYFHESFSKSLHLYGLHLARRRKRPDIYLTEGQLDVVRMWDLGLNAVAILGSSLADAQATLLQTRITSDTRIVLAMDNDEAGEAATKQALHLLMQKGFGSRVHVAKYPGKDPGDLRSKKQLEVLPWWRVLL